MEIKMKKIYLTLLCLLTISNAFGVTLEVQLDEKKGKYGYAAETGEFVIKPVYDVALPFENGRAKVCKNEKWGYINEDGKTIIPISYSVIDFFSNGQAKAKKDGKWGYIDESGKPVIPLKFEIFEPFDDNGRARVQSGGKYGYINKDGSYYIKPDYNFIGIPNSEGYVWVAKGKDLKMASKGLYRNGELIIPVKYTALGFYQQTDSIDYSLGNPIAWKDGYPKNNEIISNLRALSLPQIPYIWAKNASGISIYDLDGQQVLKAVIAAIGAPKDNYVLTRLYKKNKNKQYYNFNYLKVGSKDNEKLFSKDIQQLLDNENIFEACTPFADGFALIGDGTNAYIIDINGNQVSDTYENLHSVNGQCFIAGIGNKYGIISPKGDVLVPATYTMLAKPMGSEPIFAACEEKNGKYGCIDMNGKIVIPFDYERIYGYESGRAIYTDKGKFGVIDQNGKILVKPEWEDMSLIKYPSQIVVFCKDTDAKWNCVSLLNGEKVSAEKFDELSGFDAQGFSFVKADDKYGMINQSVEYIIPMIFTSYPAIQKARKVLDSDDDKERLSETEAYRLNIKFDPDIHKYRLHQTIRNQMWDF